MGPKIFLQVWRYLIAWQYDFLLHFNLLCGILGLEPMVYQIRTITCLFCGQEITKRMPAKRIFCSVHCRQAFRNLPENNPAMKPEGKAKISAYRKGKPTTLGLPCPEEKKLKISKSLIGKPTGRRPTQKVMDALIKAAKTHQNRPKGPNHPMWRGGLAKARQARYKEPEYKAWVLTCLKRDNYTCQKCGAYNKAGAKVILQVHHKIHYWERPDLAFDEDNGITLCKPCHQKSHNGMKKPKIPRLD